MPGEYPGEIGKRYLNEVSQFLDGNFGIRLIETGYDGPDAASFEIDGEKIRFDALFTQTIFVLGNPITNTNRLQFVCECKYRSENKDFISELIKFLTKVKKVTPYLKGKYINNFRFLFITNMFYNFDENSSEQAAFWEKLSPGMEKKDYDDFCSYVKIITLPSWFLQMLYKGVTT